MRTAENSKTHSIVGADEETALVEIDCAAREQRAKERRRPHYICNLEYLTHTTPPFNCLLPRRYLAFLPRPSLATERDTAAGPQLCRHCVCRLLASPDTGQGA